MTVVPLTTWGDEDLCAASGLPLVERFTFSPPLKAYGAGEGGMGEDRENGLEKLRAPLLRFPGEDHLWSAGVVWFRLFCRF
jgi:hypothetical protein